MAVRNMELFHISVPNKHEVWMARETISADSDVYLLPVAGIHSIGVDIVGDGVINFTIDPHEVVAEGAASWHQWDGVSQINPSVTAFQVIYGSGSVTFTVTVRAWR